MTDAEYLMELRIYQILQGPLAHCVQPLIDRLEQRAAIKAGLQLIAETDAATTT